MHPARIPAHERPAEARSLEIQRPHTILIGVAPAYQSERTSLL